MFANVTPDRNARTGEIEGYFSVRRPISTDLIDSLEALYSQMRLIESNMNNAHEGVMKSLAYLNEEAQKTGFSNVEAFVINLYKKGANA